MLTGIYLVLTATPQLSSTLQRLAWASGKVAFVAALALLLVLRWRKPLIAGLHRLYRLKVSRGGTALLVVGLVLVLTVSARYVTKLLYAEGHPYVVTDLWQSATMLILITILAVTVERQRVRATAGLLPPAVWQVALVALAIAGLALLFAPALSLAVSVPLALVALAIMWQTPFRRSLFGGVSMMSLAVAVVLAGDFRRQRVLNTFFGKPDIEYGQYQWGRVYTTLQSAFPFGPSEVPAAIHVPFGQPGIAAVHIPRGDDQLLLASLTSYVGIIPVLLLAAAIIAMSLWTWFRCRYATQAGHGRNVLRNLGLAASGLLLVSTVLSLLANFAVLRVPYGLGTAFFSPQASMLMLAAVAMVAATLMPNRRQVPTSVVLAGWATPRFMTTVGALLLGTCIWQVLVAHEYPLNSSATPPVRADILDRHGYPLATTRIEKTAPGVRRAVREYPAKSATAHLLGFAYADGSQGQEGLELSQDERLRANQDNIFAPTQLKPVWLTIDVNVQKAAHQALSDAVASAHAEAGAVVVLDKDGDIRAMVSLPDYNAGDPDFRRKLGLNYQRVFNHAIGASFSPNELLTPLMAASLIDARIYGPDTAMSLAPFRLHGQAIRDIRDYDVLPLSQAIAKSSRVAHAKMALWMSPKHWTQLMRRLGLGDYPRVPGLVGATPGRVPAYCQLTPRRQATLGFPQVTNDGKLDIDATAEVSLLQIGRAYLPFANQRGYIDRLNLLDPNPVRGGELVFGEKTVRKTLDMLEAAVGLTGTAPKARVPNIRVGGKSASIHMPPVHDDPARSIAAFVGLAPINNPKFVIAIMVQGRGDQTLLGGEVAAPVFARIVQGMTELRVGKDKVATGY
jgi:cell division protein FtsI (penicillin-binding protein 3)